MLKQSASNDFQITFDAALAQSKGTGKKVLVEFGGDWCIWSRRMAAVLSTPVFAKLIKDRFIYLEWYVGDPPWDHAEGVRLPRMEGVPFFALIDSGGRIIRTQDTDSFTLFWFYRKSKIMAFLTDWAKA